MVKYTFLLFFIISVSVVADVAPLTDPSKPLNYERLEVNQKQPFRLPKLQSIIIYGNKRHAIINNKLYKIGQSVDGYQLTQIKKQSVILDYKNRSYKLSLYTLKERVTN